MSTLENNKLIAEFLGLEVQQNGTYFDPEVNEFIRLENLDFSTSWDMLMQVVEKIEKTNLGSLEIQSKNLVLLQYNRKTDKYYNSTLIENVYNACVEFVKFYNNGKR